MVDLITNTDEILEIIVGIFALFLFGLSLSAYRSIQLKKMIFAIAAFGLFAVESFIDYLEDMLSQYWIILIVLISAFIMDGLTIVLVQFHNLYVDIHLKNRSSR